MTDSDRTRRRDRDDDRDDDRGRNDHRDRDDHRGRDRDDDDRERRGEDDGGRERGDRDRGDRDHDRRDRTGRDHGGRAQGGGTGPGGPAVTGRAGKVLEVIARDLRAAATTVQTTAEAVGKLALPVTTAAAIGDQAAGAVAKQLEATLGGAQTWLGDQMNRASGALRASAVEYTAQEQSIADALNPKPQPATRPPAPAPELVLPAPRPVPAMTRIISQGHR